MSKIIRIPDGVLRRLSEEQIKENTGMDEELVRYYLAMLIDFNILRHSKSYET